MELFITSKKEICGSKTGFNVKVAEKLIKYISSNRFADDSGRNFEDILMKFGRKLSHCIVSRPLNFGGSWAGFKVKLA